MPSDSASEMSTITNEPLITGRCYCGASLVTARTNPQIVSYCHCSDCRRITGAPVAAFAAFAPQDVSITPDPAQFSASVGVIRQFCPACGSPLMASFDYLPDQVFVPLGILDQAESLPPQLHSHAQAKLTWLHISDDLDRNSASARTSLSATRPQQT